MKRIRPFTKREEGVEVNGGGRGGGRGERFSKARMAVCVPWCKSTKYKTNLIIVTPG